MMRLIQNLAKTALCVPIFVVFACTQIQNSSEKAMVAYGFANPSLLALIDETSHTITATVPYGTHVTGLVATFAVTGKSATVGGIEQVSGSTTNDFTNPVTYTVTAADASTQDYKVIISVAAIDSKAITMFGFPALSVTGVISENNNSITATVPFGTNVARLTASFTATGTSVTMGGVEQVSGTTVNDFTIPATYIVTAADASTRHYVVTVSTVTGASLAHVWTRYLAGGTPGTDFPTDREPNCAYGGDNAIYIFSGVGASGDPWAIFGNMT